MVNIPIDFLVDPVAGYIAVVCLVVGIIGALSQTMAIPALASSTAFVYLGLQTEVGWISTLTFVFLTLMMIGIGAKLWRAEVAGDFG